MGVWTRGGGSYFTEENRVACTYLPERKAGKCSPGKRRICFLEYCSESPPIAHKFSHREHIPFQVRKLNDPPVIGPKSARFEFGPSYSNDLWIEREVMDTVPPYSTIGQGQDYWWKRFRTGKNEKHRIKSCKVGTVRRPFSGTWRKFLIISRVRSLEEYSLWWNMWSWLCPSRSPSFLDCLQSTATSEAGRVAGTLLGHFTACTAVFLLMKFLACNGC